MVAKRCHAARFKNKLLSFRIVLDLQESCKGNTESSTSHSISTVINILHGWSGICHN